MEFSTSLGSAALHFKFKTYFDSTTFFRLLVMVFILPETEGRTMEEIEMHFADNNRKITDINIREIPRGDPKLVKNIFRSRYTNKDDSCSYIPLTSK